MTKFKIEVTEGIFPWGEVSSKVTNVSFEPGVRTEWNLPLIPWT